MDNRFCKDEKLTGKTTFDELVSKGISIYQFPFRLTYLVVTCIEPSEMQKALELTESQHPPNPPDPVEPTDNRVCLVPPDFPESIESPETPETQSTPTFPARLGISVPKRKFKKAVDRNRIKRLIREVYRIHKSELLYSFLLKRSVRVHLLLFYTHNQVLDYRTMDSKLKSLLIKFCQEFA